MKKKLLLFLLLFPFTLVIGLIIWFIKKQSGSASVSGSTPPVGYSFVGSGSSGVLGGGAFSDVVSADQVQPNFEPPKPPPEPVFVPIKVTGSFADDTVKITAVTPFTAPVSSQTQSLLDHNVSVFTATPIVQSPSPPPATQAADLTPPAAPPALPIVPAAKPIVTQPLVPVKVIVQPSKTVVNNNNIHQK